MPPVGVPRGVVGVIGVPHAGRLAGERLRPSAPRGRQAAAIGVGRQVLRPRTSQEVGLREHDGAQAGQGLVVAARCARGVALGGAAQALGARLHRPAHRGDLPEVVVAVRGDPPSLVGGRAQGWARAGGHRETRGVGAAQHPPGHRVELVHGAHGHVAVAGIGGAPCCHCIGGRGASVPVAQVVLANRGVVEGVSRRRATRRRGRVDNLGDPARAVVVQARDHVGRSHVGGGGAGRQWRARGREPAERVPAIRATDLAGVLDQRDLRGRSCGHVADLGARAIGVVEAAQHSCGRRDEAVPGPARGSARVGPGVAQGDDPVDLVRQRYEAARGVKCVLRGSRALRREPGCATVDEARGAAVGIGELPCLIPDPRDRVGVATHRATGLLVHAERVAGERQLRTVPARQAHRGRQVAWGDQRSHSSAGERDRRLREGEGHHGSACHDR